MSDAPRRLLHSPKVQLATLALGHFVVDMYGGFVQPLIPVLRDRLDVRLSMMTLLVGTSHIVVNAVQPVAGIIATRSRRSTFLLLGPALAMTMVLLGLPTTVVALAAVVLIGHVGIGIYHPDGLLAAHDASGSSAHVGVPFFLSGGYLGYSFGTWLSTQWYAWYRFDGFWLLAFPGVALLVLMSLTGLPSRSSLSASPSGAVAAERGTNFYLLLALGIATVTATCILFMFLNVDLKSRWGESDGIKWGGRALAIVGLAGALASYGWGWLSRRRSLFVLIAIGQVMCVPVYLMMIWSQSGTALLAWSAPVGMVMGVSFFPLVATAARWSPQLTPALRAGIIMGGSWGFASFITMGCGWLTDWGITAGQILPFAVLTMLLAAAMAGYLYWRERALSGAHSRKVG